jgi:two-component system, LytTR family, response regulator
MAAGLLRVLVVDDEAPARQRLIDVLSKDASIAPVLEASDGIAAVTMIERERPDLVFLDVQMPELDGLGVIDAVGATLMPLTVFVTAYDQHAIRAFESNALDYLLKPYSDERLEATLARARTRLTETQAGSLLRLVAAVPRSGRYLDRLALKSAGVTRFVPVRDIDWIEGAGIYVNLHVGGKSLLYRASLTQLDASLDPDRFIRVHRSAIINIDSIVQLNAISHGEFDVVLKDGNVARVSRTYRARLEQRLGQPL